MMKLLVLVAFVLVAWRLFTGRWPWQPKLVSRSSAVRQQARTLLGVRAGAARQEILEAHRRLLATVHPDRGGSNEQVHEANAARDVLLADLPPHVQE
ncbi:J domain-containing protein [Novosphingobium sp. RD2P27]|uniref:J domain-containing protein n=1 Tax=Novosphingobium kalidii TaxID=3230299 RepID=A0ABV2CWQ3_9SPHN